MVANLNKCAADIAYKSVQAGFHFVIIGMLIDHKIEYWSRSKSLK
jgi:hypothetical protein